MNVHTTPRPVATASWGHTESLNVGDSYGSPESSSLESCALFLLINVEFEGVEAGIVPA